MTDKIHITASKTSASETIWQLILQKQPTVLCFFPDTALRFEDFQRSEIIVTGGGPEQIVSLLENEHLPQHTQTFYPGEGDSITEFLYQYDRNRLIDYLGVPVSSQIFPHRISLLKKAQKISAEHHSHRTTLRLAAMSSERPYRRKLSPQEIIEELKNEAGKQFAPYLVLQILKLVKKKDLFNLDPDFLDNAQQDFLNTFPN